MALHVSNLEKSAAFYGKLFGPGLRRRASGIDFVSFVTVPAHLSMVSGEPGIDRFCLFLEGFTIDGTLGKLKTAGFEPEHRPGSRTLNVYDPDKVRIQLAPTDYEGDVFKKAVPTPLGAFKPAGLDHVTLHASDSKRSVAFYEGSSAESVGVLGLQRGA